MANPGCTAEWLEGLPLWRLHWYYRLSKEVHNRNKDAADRAARRR